MKIKTLREFVQIDGDKPEPITLRQLCKQLKRKKSSLTGIYTSPEDMIYPEYTDELLETHGNKIVNDYIISRQGILIVEFKEEE